MSAMEALEAKLAIAVPTAFWLRPDWRGGCNLRDPGTEPFWMRKPLALPKPEKPTGDAATRCQPVRSYDAYGQMANAAALNSLGNYANSLGSARTSEDMQRALQQYWLVR